MGKLVYGVGVNDAGYPIQLKLNGKKVNCPFYQKWQDMLARCYDHKHREKYRSYMGCTVCSEWRTFSNFKRWMETQDWQGKHLDKDLLIVGNKIYSPENCLLISPILNTFLNQQAISRGAWPIGVCLCNFTGKFKAQCKNPFTKKTENLGRFACPNQAHLAWKKRKHELACQLAYLQTDQRVAGALRTRYA